MIKKKEAKQKDKNFYIIYWSIDIFTVKKKKEQECWYICIIISKLIIQLDWYVTTTTTYFMFEVDFYCHFFLLSSFN